MKDEMNAEERDILDRFEKGGLRSTPGVAKEIEAARQSAHNTFNRASERRATMTQDLRNVFITHAHKDDEGLPRLKDLVARHGMICRDGSITTGKFNGASNEEYIKYGILKPRIEWASVLVVYISPETKNSDWVNWEIECAHREGKRIVGVWEWGAKDCELPEALERLGDAVVGWNGESIIDAINGTSDESYTQDGSKPSYRSIPRHCR